jgi:hypothetical protein
MSKYLLAAFFCVGVLAIIQVHEPEIDYQHKHLLENHYNDYEECKCA